MSPMLYKFSKLRTISKITALVLLLADKARPICCLYIIGETVGRSKITPSTPST